MYLKNLMNSAAENKKKYPAGTRIRLEKMAEEAHPVPPGTLGTVIGVDDIGTILMSWDKHLGSDGRPHTSSLGLIPGVDKFTVMK